MIVAYYPSLISVKSLESGQLHERNLEAVHARTHMCGARELGLELRHSSRAHHSQGHGSPAKSTFHRRLAQDATFGELKSAAVCVLLHYIASSDVLVLEKLRIASLDASSLRKI
jgi:hypothetical protein